ncbi:MAG TPA: FAD-dependent monooxygenase [Xanthobacteraceae bacterium]|nr:FAD-dependent monooxygenase [Xanthobacteraceae bacterium]
MSARTIIIAGAGIGGLTAALGLARKGFHVELFEQAPRLEETGAGIQLSPNATRVLTGLGLGSAIEPAIVAPEALVIRTAGGRDVARLPLGAATPRYGAPYWIIHRADLQAALLAAVTANDNVTLTLGTAIAGCAAHGDGVTVQTARLAMGVPQTRASEADALIGADGLWSTVRRLIGETEPPRFARRAAWRALVPAESVAAEFRAPAVHLWLGSGAHLVHYPVKGGAMINIVAIARAPQPSRGWSTQASADEVRARFRRGWAAAARDIVAAPAQWLKWPLHDRPPAPFAGCGAVTLIGDAAHPMLPFLAQGAAMAIEDAAVLAAVLGSASDDVAAALRRYEAARGPRTARVQRAARRNDTVYHLAWPISALRDRAMARMGSDGLLARFDWIYGWQPD